MFSYDYPVDQRYYLQPATTNDLIENPKAARFFHAGKPSSQRMDNSSSRNESDNIAIQGEPHYHDILMGRAKNSQQHSGNLIFQKLILANIKIYTKSTRGGKGQVVKCLLAFLRDKKRVRFLKKRDDGRYTEILDSKVLNDKVSHALRDVQFSDGSKYCPPEARAIVKEFQAFCSQQICFETYAEKFSTTNRAAAEEQTNAVKITDVAASPSMDCSAVNINGPGERQSSIQILKSERKGGEMPRVGKDSAIQGDSVRKQRELLRGEDKACYNEFVDPEETESEVEDEEQSSVPSVRQKVPAPCQAKKPKNPSVLKSSHHGDATFTMSPVAIAKTKPTQKSCLPEKGQSSSLTLGRAPIGSQRPVHNPYKQLQACELAQSQLDQLRAHDEMQMEQLRAAQEARRLRILLSHGLDPRSYASAPPVPPSASLMLQQRAPLFANVASAVKPQKPMSGIELLSDVVDVMRAAPAQAGSNLQSRQDAVGMLSVLQATVQNQNAQAIESSLVLAHWLRGLDPLARARLGVVGYEPEPKRRRIGGYPFT